MKRKIAMPPSVKAHFVGIGVPLPTNNATSSFTDELANLVSNEDHPMPTKRIIETKILTFRDAFTDVETIEAEISLHRNEGYVVVFEHIDIANRGYFLRLERASDVDVCQRCLVEHENLNDDLLCEVCQDAKSMGEALWDDLEEANADNPSIEPDAVPMPVGFSTNVIQIDRTKPVIITAGEGGASIGLGSSNSVVMAIDPNEPVFNLVQKHGAEAVINSVQEHLDAVGKQAFADSMQKTEGLSGQGLLEEVLNAQFSS